MDIKNLIGFCVSPSLIVEPELDFWGCQLLQYFIIYREELGSVASRPKVL